MLRIRCRGVEGDLRHLYAIYDYYEISICTGKNESGLKEGLHLSHVRDDEIEFIKGEEN